MNEKTLVIFGTLGTILLGVIGSVIAWFAGGKDLTTPNKEIIRKMFNFELSILIVSIVASFIPYVGYLICAGLSIANIVFAVMAFIASDKNTEFKVPALEIIK